MSEVEARRSGAGGAGLEADLGLVAERRDRAAFARLFAFYAPRIKAYLRRLGTEDGAAEDLTQEAMLAVWRRAHQFDPARAALSTWVFTIARNKRIDALRRDRPGTEQAETRLDGTAALTPGAADQEAWGGPGGDEVAEAAQLRQVVERAVATLPPEQARLLRIFYYEEKPHSTIAAELGLPLGTVKSRLRLAMARLRTLLGDLEA